MKKILILGSTGSVGTQSLDVIRQAKDEFEVVGISTHTQVDLAARQAREFGIKKVAVTGAAEWGNVFEPDVKVYSGPDALRALCEESGADIAIGAIVGIAGLEAVMCCIECGMDIALANKETLVTGGELVTQAAKCKNVKILPVDSEHSAIFQCLQAANRPEEVKRILLTCSGGPFFGKTREELKDIKPQQALMHPNWKMGAKITIDSATLMNKGLEVIEARHLFDVSPDQIDVLIHRESVVHSMVEFVDNSILAQMGSTDMRLPIQYALEYPQRKKAVASPLDFIKFSRLSFYPPDTETFPCLALGYEALRKGSAACVALNAANEAAVKLFLNNDIEFLQIPDKIEKGMRSVDGAPRDIRDVLEIHKKVYAEAECI